jgi:hypothetical protein
MIADLIRTENFKYVFSIILGLAVVIVLFKPACKGDDCALWKAPPPTEVRGAVFKLGEKCYSFNQKDDECKSGEKYIEAFRGEFVCRNRLQRR